MRLIASARAAAPPVARRWTRVGAALGAMVYLAATLGLLLSCALPSWRPDPLGLNYVAVTPTIGTAGMPQRDQFEAIAAAGYRTVINLAPPGALGSHADEAQLVARHGMRYYNVPVDFAQPTANDYQRFAELMKAHAGEPVFVHCQMNLRASSFVFLYRVFEAGEDADRAYDDVLRLWQPVPQWRSFIRAMLERQAAVVPLALQD